MPRFTVSPRAAALPLLLFALLLLVAACGADSGAATSPSATDTLPPAPLATSAATATSGAPTSTSADVSVSDFQFSPDAISVKAGATVVWTNTATATPHTVTSDTGAFNHTLNPGDSFRFTFTKAGTFHYHCSIHPSMTAVVTVTG